MKLLLIVCLCFVGCRTDVTREVATVKEYAESYQPQIRKEKDEDGSEILIPPSAFNDMPDANTLAAIDRLASVGSRAHEKYILLIFLRHHRAQIEMAHQSYELQPNNPLVKELCRLIDCFPPDAEGMFSGVEYSWVKRHPGFQQYEPIRAEVKRIEAAEKQIEENLKETLNKKDTSNNASNRPRDSVPLKILPSGGSRMLLARGG